MRTVFSDLLERGHDEDFEGVPATDPTEAAAGTEAKIEVMRLRVELGQSLWHPLDSREQAEPTERVRYVPGIRELAYQVSRGKTEDSD